MNRYEKYKPSGVEWIGDIPEHWNSKRLKYVASVQPSNVDKKTIEGELPVLLCNYMDVYKNEFIDSSINFMKATATDPEIAKFKIKKGDVLVTKDSETPDDIANPAFVKEDFGNINVICAYHLTQIRPNGGELIGEYLFRLFQENKYKGQFEIAANGVTRFGLSVSAFSDAFVPIPRTEEQIAIASFLDEKTAQIGTLIEKKQKLIELLKEERTAIINQAVTKGINPKIRLKPSGIEWLGDIPEHWEVKKLKYLTEIISKGTTPSTIGGEVVEKGTVRFLKAENILQSNLISEEPQNYIDERTNKLLKRSELKEGDVLIVIAGATIGKIAILSQGLLPANTNQAVCFIRLSDQSLSKWIWLCLQTKYIKEAILLEAVQAAQPNLSMEKISKFVIILPPDEERISIEGFVRRETDKVDATISKIEKEIELLQEYRIALISEAVTGKIKVA